jgi:CheY-like chemotaxis protein
MNEYGHYIVLANDDREDREVMADRFRRHCPDAQFLFFNDGASVVKFLENCAPEEMPCLLILDDKAPIVSGEDVLQALHANPRYQGIYKIVVGASSDLAYIDQCLACGADRYFIRPAGLPPPDDLITGIVGIYAAAVPGVEF